MKYKSTHFRKKWLIQGVFILAIFAPSAFADFDEQVRDVRLQVMAAERIFYHDEGKFPVGAETSPEVWAVLRAIQNYEVSSEVSPNIQANFQRLLGAFERWKLQSPALRRLGDAVDFQKSQLDVGFDISNTSNEDVPDLSHVYSKVVPFKDLKNNLDKVLAVKADRKAPNFFQRVFPIFWDRPDEFAQVVQICKNIRKHLKNENDRYFFLTEYHKYLPPLTHLEYFDILAEFNKESQVQVSRLIRDLVFTQAHIFGLENLKRYMDVIHPDIMLRELEKSKIYIPLNAYIELSKQYGLDSDRLSKVYLRQRILTYSRPNVKRDEGAILLAELADLPVITLQEAKTLLNWVMGKKDPKTGTSYTQEEKDSAMDVITTKVEPKRQGEFASIVYEAKKSHLLPLKEEERFLTLNQMTKTITSENLKQLLTTISSAPIYHLGDNARLNGFRDLLNRRYPQSGWTSWELASMHVSLNLALAAQALHLTRVTLNSQDYDAVYEMMDGILASSEVGEVQGADIEKVKARGVTAEGLVAFVQEELNRLNPAFAGPRSALKKHAARAAQAVSPAQLVSGVDLATLRKQIQSNSVPSYQQTLNDLAAQNQHQYSRPENPGALSNLADRLNDRYKTQAWTAEDLQKMHVSENVAALADLLAIYPRAGNKDEYRRVKAGVASVLSASSIEDIKGNSFKATQGVTVDKLRDYFFKKAVKKAKPARAEENFQRALEKKILGSDEKSGSGVQVKFKGDLAQFLK